MSQTDDGEYFARKKKPRYINVARELKDRLSLNKIKQVLRGAIGDQLTVDGRTK